MACLLKVYWLKDKAPVDADQDVNVIISNEGNLIVSQVRLSDAGNYTCVAENVASRRLSEPAQLTVYGLCSYVFMQLCYCSTDLDITFDFPMHYLSCFKFKVKLIVFKT